LDGGPGRGLARPLGHKPDADQRVDAQATARRTAAEGYLPAFAGDGTSKSAASRRFVALSAERLTERVTSDLSKLDLLVIQIDGLHIGDDLVLVAALGSVDAFSDTGPISKKRIPKHLQQIRRLCTGKPPRHPLRNGRLNQSAYSLFLFIRTLVPCPN
jgi:hypothetical protein